MTTTVDASADAARAPLAQPVEFSTKRTPPRWLVIGAGVLGLLVLALFLLGVAVTA